ncbi:uncharacterized protein VP01_6782g1, partial [Puccinia sorghi]
MIQQALEGTLGYSIVLTDKELVLDSEEDMLLKTALLATINDDTKVGVAESLSGLDGFQLTLETFVLQSRTSHIASVKQILDLKFNHLDQSADLDANFRRIKNMVKNLIQSGFFLLEESLIGLFFHLSLPNLESFPFVNVAQQLDLHMEQGSMVVKNMDLLQLAKNKLMLFLNNRKPQSDRKNDKQPFASNSTSHAPSQGAVSRWCDKCKELKELIEQGERLFGLDSCASHTFTHDLSILFDTTPLINPLPLNVATNVTKSYVTTVGKMKLKNRTGSITLNNVYYCPNAACTLLSAETLRLGGVPEIVTSTCPPVVFVPPVNHVSESKH